MIDYYAHAAGLELIRAAIDAAATGGSLHAAAWAETKSAVAAEPGYALLGTLFDHLLERSQGASQEHDLLEEAAGLFQDSAHVLTVLADLRARLETMVLTPASATPEQITTLSGQLNGLKPRLTDLQARVNAYRGKLTPPFRYIQSHAIASDQPVASWLWRDVILSRRTAALVSAVREAGDGSPPTRAFAFGILAGYAANCVGSSYLAHVVRGPRRSHPIRDRIARYAVGAWLRTNEPALCPSLTDLRAKLKVGNPASPKLSNAVKTQIKAALAAAFPLGAPAAPPDFDAGYANLLRHLELLESFGRLPLPPDINSALLGRIMLSAQASTALTKPQDWDQRDPNDPGRVPDDPTPQPGGAQVKAGGDCAAIAIIIIVILLLLYVVIHKLATGEWPWEESDPKSESPGASAQALQAFLASDDALAMVAAFYNAHVRLHDAIVRGGNELKLAGLIYPDELDFLGTSRFAPFTALPSSGPQTAHPHQAMPDPSDGYLDPPATPIEEPGTNPSEYPAGATPSVFLRGVPGSSVPTIGAAGAALWLAQQQAPPPAGQANLNADADRGDGHPCWRVRPGSSIKNSPLDVVILGFDDVD